MSAKIRHARRAPISPCSRRIRYWLQERYASFSPTPSPTHTLYFPPKIVSSLLPRIWCPCSDCTAYRQGICCSFAELFDETWNSFQHFLDAIDKLWFLHAQESKDSRELSTRHGEFFKLVNFYKKQQDFHLQWNIKLCKLATFKQLQELRFQQRYHIFLSAFPLNRLLWQFGI